MWHFENMTPCFDLIEKNYNIVEQQEIKNVQSRFRKKKNAIYTSYCIKLLYDKTYEGFFFYAVL